MDFEKIYNECNKFSEKILADDEYGIEVFTSDKWETVKTEHGRYNLYDGSPVAFKNKQQALDLLKQLKDSPKFINNKMRIYKDIKSN